MASKSEEGGQTGGGQTGGGQTGGGQGWFWVPGGIVFARGAPMLMGKKLPGWPGALPASVQMVLGAEFPDGAWDPLLKAAVVATRFAQIADWDGLQAILDPLLNLSEEAVRSELAVLYGYQDKLRKGVEDEILAQAGDFTPYFGDLLGASPVSRPATWSLLLMGLQVGGLITAHFKMIYRRPRPSQVWPIIAPDIVTPPHPAFPSGHALQAFLMARFASLAAPAMGPICAAMADKIALNREIAGVHWPSDKAASAELVEPVTKMMEGVDLFRETLQKARGEWTPRASTNKHADGMKRAAGPNVSASASGAPEGKAVATAGNNNDVIKGQ